ncbi:DEAD/DEAH box helicase [Pseudomonas sp. 2FE]|uniref:DEAD/DEAH box helicase n=1 Tax=Pseudomonas sp. 2FE TaxID=2502190 RepID=UPI0010F54AD4|nr:DEAD/DEAH box helicase [Pseudomonas sp. 2FE]
MQLRPYQDTQLNMLREGISQRQLIQMLMSPTGSGKTEVAKAIIASAANKLKRAWFVVDSVKLLDQTLARFHKDGLYAGAIQSDHPCTDYSKQIQVATVQSLRPRLAYMLNHCRPNLVLIDEAHVIHQTHLELIEWCRANKVPVIGLSATPFRRGLGKIFDRLVSCITTEELTDQGFLVPTTCYAPFVPSLKGVRTNADGDYIEDELAKVMGDAQIIGDIVSHWKELGENRKTLVFACNVAHSKRIAEEFFNAGIMAAHIDGYMPQHETDEILRLYAQGKIKVLVSVAMLIKGFDDPSTSCLILARPTKSLQLHYQMIGRVLRLSPETWKIDGIIIDHAGNLLLNGLPTDALPDRMDMGDGDPVDRRKQDKADQEQKTKPCPKCSFIFSGLMCPRCGNEITVADGVAVATGKLVKLEDRRKVLGPTSKQHIFSELLGYAQEKGKKEGWAQYAYQAYMKELPDRTWIGAVQPNLPSPDMINWVKGYNVRRAKSKKRFA